jgi:hypothetical protein
VLDKAALDEPPGAERQKRRAIRERALDSRGIPDCQRIAQIDRLTMRANLFDERAVTAAEGVLGDIVQFGSFADADLAMLCKQRLKLRCGCEGGNLEALSSCAAPCRLMNKKCSGNEFAMLCRTKHTTRKCAPSPHENAPPILDAIFQGSRAIFGGSCARWNLGGVRTVREIPFSGRVSIPRVSPDLPKHRSNPLANAFA